MLKILAVILTIAAGLHGLIHLMGFAAYWPLAKVAELPYKTTVLGGRLDLGPGGMRAFSLLWLLAGLGMVGAALALLAGRPWWAPLMLGAALLSLALCILDWGAAFRGVWIDAVLLLALAVVFGLRVAPAPFPAYAAASTPVETVPLPAGLPQPVEHYFRLLYGEQIPVYHSAVISGRGTIRFMGVTMPGRLRFTHISGQGYRHYMETAFFGLPVLKVNERYLDGRSRLELPFGVAENDPKVDSAANQGLWAETFIYPAFLLTDPRVRWEAVDQTTARMYVPFGAGEQEFSLTFDPQTGLLMRYDTLRYRDEKLGILHWWGDFSYRLSPEGRPQATGFAATWEDEGTPWLTTQVEDIRFNPDVSAYIQQKGP